MRSPSGEFQGQLEELLIEQEHRGYEPIWVYFQLEEEFYLGLPELTTIGEALEFKPSWAIRTWREQRGVRG